MNINLDSNCVRFFEKDDRAFAAGTREISMYDSSLKGENALLVPFGIQSFEGKECLKIILNDECKLKFTLFEGELVEKMKQGIPIFLKDAGEYHSKISADFEGNTILKMALSKDVKIEEYNVKKGTFSKLANDQVPSGSKVSFGMKILHPWTLDIKGCSKYGVRIVITELIVYNDGEQKRKMTDSKLGIKEFMVSKSKKRTKLLEHKDL